MAQEEAEAELEPAGAPVTIGPAWPAEVDGAALLRAIERVGAEVGALNRLVAIQPEEVAARVDVDAATAAVAVRVGALSGTLDQLRLSLLLGLDRAIDRFDHPSWLPRLQAAVSEDRRLDQLLASVTSLSDGVRAGAAIADALENVGERLAALEGSAERVADVARALGATVAPLPDRLQTISVQVDRITPLARAGDDAGSLLGQLDRVRAGLAEVVRHLEAGAPGRAANSHDDKPEHERLDAVVEVLAQVTRRQDELTPAISAVLDQVRGPAGLDAVLDRIEQRERSLVTRLDRIEGGLRRNDGLAAAKADDLTPDLRAALDRLDQQERAVASQLERVGQRLAEVAGRQDAPQTTPDGASAPAADPVSERFDSVVEVLADLSRRQGDLATAIDRRLSAIEKGLAAVAPTPGSVDSTRAAALRLADLRAERARVQAHLQDERLLARRWDQDLGDGR